MFLLDNNKAGYIWDSNWILPYESLWGITEKFLYLNRLDRLNHNQFPIKIRPNSEYCPDYQNYIYYGTLKYNPSELAQCFELNLEKHYDFFKIFFGNSLEDYMDKMVKLCPECIKMGYHSYIHQLIFEKNCFKHNGELIYTEIPYCMNYSPHSAYKEEKGEPWWLYLIPAPDELLLQLIRKKTKLAEEVNLIQDIVHIEIINLNDRKIEFHSNKNLLYNYLQTLFHCSEPEKYDRILISMNKSKAQADWKDYSYKPPQHFKEDCFSWFSNFCYNFSDALYKSCDETLLLQTLTEFENSYLAQSMREVYYDYDPTAISIIVTSAILTGYTYQKEKTMVFSKEWKKRKRICLCEDDFLLKIIKCKEDYLKTIYLELYKLVVVAACSVVRRDANLGMYSKINYFQINGNIELPIYLILERTNKIEIAEI